MNKFIRCTTKEEAERGCPWADPRYTVPVEGGFMVFDGLDAYDIWMELGGPIDAAEKRFQQENDLGEHRHGGPGRTAAEAGGGYCL